MPIQIELPVIHFKTVIRCIKKFAFSDVDFLRNHTYHTMKRLKIKRDPSKAVAGVPYGSDHLNMLSIVEWMNKIPARTDETAAACDQIIAIDATCVSRTTG